MKTSRRSAKPTNSRFTQRGPRVDAQINSYLKPVVASLVETLPGVTSILLAGGFGRGEGAVELVNGKAIPVNDLELFAITDSKLPETVVNHAASKASKACPIQRQSGHSFAKFNRRVFSDTFYVDLKVLAMSELPKLLPMIRYYELKHASQVVWGEDVRRLMPDYSVAELPQAEGLRVLLNRLSLCLLYFDTAFFNRSLKPFETRALSYLAAKSIVDIPTALLLLTNQFVPNYDKRATVFSTKYAQDFPKLHRVLPTLPKHVRTATNFKLKPNFKPIKDPIKRWGQYKRYGGQALLYLVSQMSSSQIVSHQELISALMHIMPTQYYQPYLQSYLQKKYQLNWYPSATTWLFQRYYNLLMMWRMGTLQNRWHLPLTLAPLGYDVHLFCAMIGLLFSLNQSKDIDAELLRLADHHLRIIYPVKQSFKPTLRHWQYLNKQFANAYLLFGYLKLV